MGHNYPRAPTAKIQGLALRDITDSSAAPTSGCSAEYPFAQPGCAHIHRPQSNRRPAPSRREAKRDAPPRWKRPYSVRQPPHDGVTSPRPQFSRGRALPYPTHSLQQCRRSRLLSGTVAHFRTARHALRVSPHHTYETQRPATRANGECASELTSDSQPSASLESDAGARGTLISRSLVTAFT
jgi:hypothetical protein